MNKEYNKKILNVGDLVSITTRLAGYAHTTKEEILVVKERLFIKDYIYVEFYSITSNCKAEHMFSNEDCKFLFETQKCGKRLGSTVEWFKLL